MSAKQLPQDLNMDKVRAELVKIIGSEWKQKKAVAEQVGITTDGLHAFLEGRAMMNAFTFMKICRAVNFMPLRMYKGQVSFNKKYCNETK